MRRTEPADRKRAGAAGRLAACLTAALLCGVAARAQVALPQRGDHSVYDGAGVIRDDARREMERRHLELLRKTGVALVIVTVPRLEGEPIADFALRVGESWGVGRSGEDRGLIVAFALEERRIFVATGYGTEGYLPDSRVGRLLDQYVVPYLARDDFSTGLLQASRVLVQASAEEFGVSIGGATPVPAPQQQRRDEGGGAASAVVALLGLILMVYLAVRHPRLFMLLILSGAMRGGHRGGGGFGGGGFGSGGGFGGGGFGGGGAGRSF